MHDALEALVAIAGASEEGRLVALQSGGIAAAATAIQVGNSVRFEALIRASHVRFCLEGRVRWCCSQVAPLLPAR